MTPTSDAKSVARPVLHRPRDILVVGQRPPPVHGTTVMAERLLETLGRLGIRHAFIDKRLSVGIQEIGRIGPSKVLRGAAFLARVAAARLPRERPCLGIYFLSCSRAAFLADAWALEILSRRGVAPLLYLHGIGFRRLAASGGAMARLVARVFRRAEGTIVLGKAGAEDVRPWMESESLRVIPNVVPDVRREARAQPETAGPIRCLYFSTLDPAKGATDFVAMAGVLADRLPAVDFVLAGQAPSPEMERRLREEILASGHDDRIRLLGPRFGPDRDALLAESHVFVFPTRYEHENQPLVLLEAMRQGLPVISTRLGSIPDQVEEGGNGFLVPPGDRDALADRALRLCTDEELRRRLGGASRRRYEERFSQTAFESAWRRTLEWAAQRLEKRPAGV